MPQATITIDVTKGIFSATKVVNSAIALGAESLRSAYVGDTSFWQLSGTYTANEDNVVFDLSGGQSESTAYGYADLTGDGYTEVAWRVTYSGSNPDGTSNIEFKAVDSNGSTITDTTTNMPTGAFSEQQTTFTATAPNIDSGVARSSSQWTGSDAQTTWANITEPVGPNRYVQLQESVRG